MQKTYLSRAMTKAMALDHPIGDPTGGAAYGEKNDPISAIISIASMASTYAAAGTFAAMTLTQGLVFAGAAISLTGNITGNKTLSKIGLIAGLAGGVGMLAEKAFDTTIGSSLGETFGSSAAAPAAELGAAAAPGVEVTPLGADFNAPSTAQYGTSPLTENLSLEASLPGGMPPGPADLAAGPGALPGPNLEAGVPGVTAPTVTGPGAADAANLGTATTGAGPTMPGETPYDPATATRRVDFKPMGGGGMMDTAKAAGDWMQKNPMLTMVGAQAASGLSNWLSGKTDAEIDALKAQTGYSNAKAIEVQAALDREKLRRSNLNAGYTQVNTGMSVNPNAGVAQPWTPPQPQPQAPAGLIAGARG